MIDHARCPSHMLLLRCSKGKYGISNRMKDIVEEPCQAVELLSLAGLWSRWQVMSTSNEKLRVNFDSVRESSAGMPEDIEQCLQTPAEEFGTFWLCQDSTKQAYGV